MTDLSTTGARPIGGRGHRARSATGIVLPARSRHLVGHPPQRSRSTVETDSAPASAAPSPTGQLPGLDGLRALAVVAVIAYHLGELPGGFLGVDVFFVVSGFLITRLLLAEQERTGRISLRAFWGRRFRRLVPALLVVVAATAIASRAWLPRFRLGDIRTDAFAALGYVANWRFTLSGQSYFTAGVAPSPLRHMWSLAIEEQFYVLWPLFVVGVIALARRRARGAVMTLSAVGAVASAAWMAISSAHGDLSRVYYGTDTRVFALCAGAWLSTWWDGRIHCLADPAERHAWRRRARRSAAVSTIALGVLFVIGTESAGWFYRFGFQATAVLAVVTVAGVATGGGMSGRIFANPILGWLGRRSYGLYLWSWPIQVVLSEGFRLSRLPLAAAVVTCSLALAALSYWLVEQPVRLRRAPTGFGGVRWSRPGRGRSSGVIRPSFAAAGVSIAVVLSIVTGASWRGTEPPSYLHRSDREALENALAPATTAAGERQAATWKTQAPPSSEAKPPPGPFDATVDQLVDPAAQVPPGTVRGRPLRVLVTGDSVGWTLAWNLRGETSPDLLIDDRALIACGALPPSGSYFVGDGAPVPYPEPCQQAGRAEEIGLSAGPDVVLLTVGAWEVYDQEYGGGRHDVGDKDYGRYLEKSVQDRIDSYRGYGVPTVLALLPCYGRGAVRLGIEREDPKRVAWVNARLRAVAARNPGWVRMIDPRAQLCTSSGQSRTETPTGVALREDGVHFNDDAAIWLWDSWLAGQIGAVMEGSVPSEGPAATDQTTTSPPQEGPMELGDPVTGAPDAAG